MVVQTGAYHISLCYQLLWVKLGNRSLQDLVSDGREYSIVIVLSEALVDLRQILIVWMRQYTQGERDTLHGSADRRGEE